MKLLREVVSIGLCWMVALPIQAQSPQLGIEPVRPTASIFRRPYLPVTVPPARLGNSDRMTMLIRAGKLYLNVHDAIALALENNIDIENARYNATLLSWNLERAQAGGALPGVPSASSQAQTVQNGQGVLGSQQAAGVQVPGSRGGSSGTANATVSQVGPVTANLDPAIQQSDTFSHRSNPQPNVVQSQTAVLVQGARNFTASYQQGFLSGGNITISFAEHYLNENAPSDVLNPSVAPTQSFNLQQNLLRGLGVAVNARNITVAKMNLADADLNFKTQVSRVVANVLNVYYSLVASSEDVRAKQSALETAQRFYDESKQRFELGALAQLDITSAQNQVATSQLALINSNVARRQQELQLKNLISRTGPGDPLIADVEIVPVDHLTIPGPDDLPSVKDLAKQAIANRSDLVVERHGIESSKISALGTKNGLLPGAQAIAGRSTAGLAGSPRVVSALGQTFTSDPYYVGGLGNALGQIFRQNYPTENVGGFGTAQIYNRQAQADYAIDVLSLRQQQLMTARDMNQAEVDVNNSVVALRQSRARYEAAVQSRILQQQLYDAEEKRFTLGASTPYNVVAQQRDLAAAQAAELSSLATYQSALINLDQTTGTTLEKNHVVLTEAQSGKVSQPSALPASLPQQ
jgi:outer membrane protein